MPSLVEGNGPSGSRVDQSTGGPERQKNPGIDLAGRSKNGSGSSIAAVLGVDNFIVALRSG